MPRDKDEFLHTHRRPKRQTYSYPQRTIASWILGLGSSHYHQLALIANFRVSLTLFSLKTALYAIGVKFIDICNLGYPEKRELRLEAPVFTKWTAKLSSSTWLAPECHTNPKTGQHLRELFQGL